MDLYFDNKNLNSLPDDPDENFYEASIALEQHKLLSYFFIKSGEKGIYFPFFEDFLLSPGQVNELFEIFKNNYNYAVESNDSKEAYCFLIKILEKAKNKKLGIIGFCD